MPVASAGFNRIAPTGFDIGFFPEESARRKSAIDRLTRVLALFQV